MNCKALITIILFGISLPLAGTRAQVETAVFSKMPENTAKETVLYFRFDRSTVDNGYRSNCEALSALHELFSNSLSVSRIDSVSICAFSSPEGNPAYNHLLPVRRARAVKGYLVWKYPYLDQHRIRTSSHLEDWEALRVGVENDPKLPCRDKVLQIPAFDVSHARKEFLLKKLNTGIPYRYISDKLLPNLRNASVCTVYMRPLKHPDSAHPEVSVLSGSRASSSLSSVAADSSSFSPAEAALPAVVDKYDLYLQEMKRLHPGRVPLLALKTNLLFDAALMPNIEVEVPFGKRWSLNGSLMFPWWLMGGDKYCLEILMGELEGRYWLGSREARNSREILTGHFLGLYAGGGKYDLQWKENGYQGEFFIAAGISYGWATRIARNLHLEFSLGIGLLRTDYRHYHARDNYQTLLWQENGNYTWFGPTKAKISLVWLLNRKTSKKIIDF